MRAAARVLRGGAGQACGACWGEKRAQGCCGSSLLCAGQSCHAHAAAHTALTSWLLCRADADIMHESDASGLRCCTLGVAVCVVAVWCAVQPLRPHACTLVGITRARPDRWWLLLLLACCLHSLLSAQHCAQGVASHSSTRLLHPPGR